MAVRLGYDAPLLAAIAGRLARAVMQDMRRSVKQQHGLASVASLHAGVFTVVQRFRSDLGLYAHLQLRFLAAPPERMTAVLAQVHEVVRVADDDLDLDPALAACLQLSLAGPHLAPASQSAPPPMTLSAFGMNLHAATTADGRDRMRSPELCGAHPAEQAKNAASRAGALPPFRIIPCLAGPRRGGCAVLRVAWGGDGSVGPQRSPGEIAASLAEGDGIMRSRSTSERVQVQAHGQIGLELRIIPAPHNPRSPRSLRSPPSRTPAAAPPAPRSAPETPRGADAPARRSPMTPCRPPGRPRARPLQGPVAQRSLPIPSK